MMKKITSLTNITKFWTGVVILVIVSLTAVTTPASAHIKCWPVDVLIPYLQETHEESPFITAISKNGTPVQVWRSRWGDTWTFVVYRLPNLACILDAGTDMKPMRWQEPVESEPA